MKTTPVELRQLEFKKVLRGCDINEVRLYLERAADDIEALLIENKALKEEVERYKKLEIELNESIVRATDDAKAIMDKAYQDADGVGKRVRQEIEAEENNLNRLKMERKDFIMQFKSLLNSYITVIAEEE